MSGNPKATVQCDNVVLYGLDADLKSNNATSKTYVDSKVSSAVSGLLNGAGAAYDTLKELQTAIESTNNTIAVEILTKIATEKKDREDADVLISDRIDTLSMTAENEMSARSTADAEEKKAREDADVLLNDRADSLTLLHEAEQSARVAGDLDEMKARESADNTERTARIAGDALKFDKVGGVISGDVVLDSFLYFGSSWRVRASSDGTRITFEFKRNDMWEVALPFISPSN